MKSISGRKPVIDESEARLIASQWHGGQFSALYAFSSSGTILDALEGEITGELPAEKIELEALLDYLKKRRHCDLLKELDKKHDTDKRSPLHHDKRCKIVH